MNETPQKSRKEQAKRLLDTWFEHGMISGEEHSLVADSLQSETRATELERRYHDALHHIAMNGVAHKDWKFAQLVLDGKSVDEAKEQAIS